ncbi:MAG: DNA adenine methylase [Gammaproteobacteria bacterium]|nr:DNA adenine methylase [Gammaproteobacteria bacterium]
MAIPIIPWIGGKRRLAKPILDLFPAHTCYVEAFCGAAAIFFSKESSDVEVLNDINGELVNLYRVVQHHLEEFVRQFKWALSSRQVFEWERKKNPETMTDIQRAARFFYLQKLSFGGRVESQAYGTATTTGPRLNLLRIEEDLREAHLRMHGAHIENLPWEQVITKYDREHTLFYLDPPYWQTEGYGVEFGIENYRRMAELARSINGSVVISINDHPDMRRIFAGLHSDVLGITYTVGGGAQTSQARELLLWNEHCETRRRETGTLRLF